MCQYICDLNNVGKVKNDIASYLYSYLNEDMLMAYLYFVCAFVDEFFDPHFNWHKHMDAKSKRAGFLSVHSGIYFYVMHRNLELLKNDWKTRDAFRLFLSKYPNNMSLTPESFVNDFLNLTKQRMHKHMDQWRTRNLPLVLGGDTNMAQYIACWLLNKPFDQNTVYNSDKHKTEIDVQKCGEFLTQLTTPLEHHDKTAVRVHHDAIIKISEGEDLWNSLIPSVINLRAYMSGKFLSFGSNNQLTERWVKDSNECTYLKKDEKMSNIYAMVRSFTVLQFQEDANEELADRTRKGNLYFNSGKKGERMDRRTGVVEGISDTKDSDIRGSIFLEVVLKETIKMKAKLEEIGNE